MPAYNGIKWQKFVNPVYDFLLAFNAYLPCFTYYIDFEYIDGVTQTTKVWVTSDVYFDKI